MSVGELAIGIDIGGTKIAAGVVTATGELTERLHTPTPNDTDGPSGLLSVLEDLVAQLRERYPSVVGVGVGAAGMVEWPGGFIRWAPNNSYRQLPLRECLAERFPGLPVVVDNDANAAAWAEYRFAGIACSSMLFLTVGTGVGGGLVLDGQLYRGQNGIAGEVGHLIVDSEGDARCGCGNIGCLEAVASGTALERMGRAAAEYDPHGSLATTAGTPRRVDGRTITQAARAGDPTACQLFETVGCWLGLGVATLVNVLDFETVVVGGGLATAGDLLLTPARAKFEQLLFGRNHRNPPAIELARFGPEAGVIGAGALALIPAVE